MHTLSTLSIDRAVNRLAKTTHKKYTTRITAGPLAEVIDDNGDVLDYDIHPPNLVRRLDARISEIEIKQLFEEGI